MAKRPESNGMRSPLSILSAAASVAFVSVAAADVPFQQLADFGLGGSPFDVNSSGRIVGGGRPSATAAALFALWWVWNVGGW